MIDEDFRTWLIEINTNPYLGVPNEFIGDLLPKMLDDMLSKVLDKKYPKSTESKKEENGFKLLYKEEFNVD